MNIEKIKKMDRRIVRRLLKLALAAGFSVSVFDGEEVVLKQSSKQSDIMGKMFSVDDEKLYFHYPEMKTQWVYLTYGECGYDVICDSTVGDGHPVWQQVMKQMDEYVDKMAYLVP